MKIPRHIFVQFSRAVAVAMRADPPIDPEFNPSPAFLIIPLAESERRTAAAIALQTTPYTDWKLPRSGILMVEPEDEGG